jgi:hypothetical protein
MSGKSWRLLLCVLVALASAFLLTAQAQKQDGPTLYSLDHMDVSPPLREMKQLPPNPRRENPEPVMPLPRPYAGSLFRAPDAALQATLAPPLVAVTAGLNFAGVGVPFFISDCCVPPDTNGSAGSTQYVQWVNASFAVFNKATGAVVNAPASGNTLWTGFGGPCETDNNGDPIALYDKAANRWILTQFAVGAAPYMQCIAVSTTSNATGSYRRFAYSFGSFFNDYPKVGVWPDAYYMTFNMFSGGTTFVGAEVCAIDRNQMVTVSGVPGPIQCFQTTSAFGGLLPADLDGATPPPAGSPNYVLAFDFSTLSDLDFWKFHTDWVTPANSTFTGPTLVPVTAFFPACAGGRCITQPGTTQLLDSLADRLMYRLAYRNFGDHESLVVNHSVDVTDSGSGPSGVRWYEIRNPGGTPPTVFQQGTFSPDSTHRWMGSIAMDQAGNMLLGYSASSGSVPPSIRITGRLASDPLGQMQPETEVFTGVGSQVGSFAYRWGDYSAMSLDPVDDCTFFYTNQYLQTTGVFKWSTRISSFKFPSCGSGGKFYSLTPCRVADTRNPVGPSGGPALAANTSRSFPAAGICGIPSDAAAIAVNVTVVDETAMGDLRLFPASGSLPSASTINFTVNKVRANNAIISLGAGGQIAVRCDMAPASTGSTNLLFDVTGYFK